MQLAMVGLGRMGANLVRRLMRAGHRCVVYDAQREAIDALVGEGATAAHTLDALVAALDAPRAVWVMLPHGEATESTIAALAQRLAPGDLVIDGGNTHFHDDARRARELAARSIHYLDIGTSGWRRCSMRWHPAPAQCRARRSAAGRWPVSSVVGCIAGRPARATSSR
jgi:6-phosphogluconate dehydrogenase